MTKNTRNLVIMFVVLCHHIRPGEFGKCTGSAPTFAELIDYLLFKNTFLIVPPTSKREVEYRIFNGTTSSEYVTCDVNDIACVAAVVNWNKTFTFLVPGYHQNALTDFPSLFIEPLLGVKDTNVIILDWSVESTNHYHKGILAMFWVAKRVADSINKMLTEKGLDVSKIYCIGHSLGAYLAGLIGRYFKNPKLGRITGLDPAGPLLNVLYRFIGLTSNDASFVDCFHSDRGGYGTERINFCTLDVLMNCNGYRFQPGCPFTPVPMWVDRITACSHILCAKLFIQTIFFPKNFLARSCPSFFDFEIGRCQNNSIVTVGYGGNTSATGLVYIVTGPDPPYALGAKGADRMTLQTIFFGN